MGKYVIILICLVCSYTATLGQNYQWVEAEGECYAVHLTPEEAKRKAIDNARAQAIQLAVGVKVTQETFSNTTEVITGTNANEFRDLFSKFNRTSAYGKIIEEKITELPPRFESNIPVYKVRIKAKVAEEKGTPDPNFTAEIITKNNVLYDRGDSYKNDAIDFKLWASRDCYLYLFNIMANDSIQLVFPNDYITDNFYSVAAKEQNFEKRMRELNLKYYVKLPEGMENAVEGFMLIALKEKVDFISRGMSDDGSGIISTYKGALTDIMNWLVRIPLDKRAEAFAAFEIRRKSAR